MATEPTPTNDFDMNRPTIISLLYVGSFLAGITSIIGVILAYVWNGETHESWQDSHFRYHIRTFWIGFVWSFVALVGSILTLGLLVVLVLGGRPSAAMFVKVLPFVPAILLAATLNAFYEEVTFKASFLSVLENVVGRQQALLLMAAFFGFLHFYGVPYGVLGVLMGMRVLARTGAPRRTLEAAVRPALDLLGRPS